MRAASPPQSPMGEREISFTVEDTVPVLLETTRDDDVTFTVEDEDGGDHLSPASPHRIKASPPQTAPRFSRTDAALSMSPPPNQRPHLQQTSLSSSSGRPPAAPPTPPLSNSPQTPELFVEMKPSTQSSRVAFESGDAADSASLFFELQNQPPPHPSIAPPHDATTLSSPTIAVITSLASSATSVAFELPASGQPPLAQCDAQKASLPRQASPWTSTTAAPPHASSPLLDDSHDASTGSITFQREEEWDSTRQESPTHASLSGHRGSQAASIPFPRIATEHSEWTVTRGSSSPDAGRSPSDLHGLHAAQNDGFQTRFEEISEANLITEKKPQKIELHVARVDLSIPVREGSPKAVVKSVRSLSPVAPRALSTIRSKVARSSNSADTSPLHPQPWQSPTFTPKKQALPPSPLDLLLASPAWGPPKGATASRLASLASSSAESPMPVRQPASVTVSSLRESSTNKIASEPRNEVVKNPPDGSGDVLSSHLEVQLSPRSDDGMADHRRSASRALPIVARAPSPLAPVQSAETSNTGTPRYMQSTSATRQRQSSDWFEAKRRQFQLLHGARRGEELFSVFLRNSGTDVHEVNRSPRRHHPDSSAGRRRDHSLRRSALDLVPPTDSAGPPDESTANRPASPAIWERLYHTPLKHPPKHPSPVRIPVSHPPPRIESRSSSPEIFQKLYRCGLDDKARRDKMFIEGQANRLKQELQESMEHAVVARLLRTPNDGHHHHQLVTKDAVREVLAKERERLMDSIATTLQTVNQRRLSESDHHSNSAARPHPSRPLSPAMLLQTAARDIAFSAEPKLPQERIEELSARLYRHGRRKYAEEENAKIARELKECTFRPNTTAGRSNSAQGRRMDSATTPRSRQPSVDRCKQLFEYSAREKTSQNVLREKAMHDKKMKILREKMDSDHHFRRRVKQDPSLAEKFMASLQGDLL